MLYVWPSFHNGRLLRFISPSLTTKTTCVLIIYLCIPTYVYCMTCCSMSTRWRDIVVVALYASVNFVEVLICSYYKAYSRINGTAPRKTTVWICFAAYLTNATMNNENFKSSPQTDESDLIFLQGFYCWEQSVIWQTIGLSFKFLNPLKC